ncbi:hypothetical protein A2W24_04970 [Microgenomates group bacterium RBG_16_45_19]|nr:MAG: hypothetical protein A2W24_04970 [Microgenomates group bacterium RBG_16_45_19]
MVKHRLWWAAPVLSLIFAFWLRTILATNAESNPAGIDLQLIPVPPTLTAGSPVDIEVWVTPNGNQVTAAELRLTFDPQVLQPRSPHPVATAAALALVLPNCTAGPPAPACPATSSATPEQALIYLGVNCTEAGCPVPDPQSRFLLATLELNATATAAGVTAIDPVSPPSPTLTAALAFDTDATRLASTTSLTITPCALTYDFNPDGRITVVDIMQPVSHWLAGPGHQDYNGQFDVTGNGTIDIQDIQTVAHTWNQSCLEPNF